jgi:hypothetical protein
MRAVNLVLLAAFVFLSSTLTSTQNGFSSDWFNIGVRNASGTASLDHSPRHNHTAARTGVSLGHSMADPQ